MLKKIDIYIIKKFLGTFFFSIAIILSIAIIFDISEKIDDLKDAPLHAIVFQHYLNFIPFYSSLFSPLFTLIAVLYFTSRMASHFEIVAMVSNGISLIRIGRPYMISAAIIAIMIYVLGHFVIPHSNKERIDFENTYINNPYKNNDIHIHRQVQPETFVYLESFNVAKQRAQKVSIEKFKNSILVSKLVADSAEWKPEKDTWELYNYYKRDINAENEKITKGARLDTNLMVSPVELSTRQLFLAETLDFFELNDYIKLHKFRGENVNRYLLEKYRRTSNAFSIIVLTIIGLSLAIRQLRGGVGAYIGIGLMISFIYILFSHIFSTYAIDGGVSPLLAVWLPNLGFSLLALGLIVTNPQ